MNQPAHPQPLTPSIEFDGDLVRRLDRPGPRYTSYPTADRFSGAFGAAHYRDAVAMRNRLGARRALSLYVHLPFCSTVCYYCACNKIITRDPERLATYLDFLLQEIRLHSALFTRARYVEQLHWGGGTPTALSDVQITRLMQGLRQHFQLAPDTLGEYSIEIDPRTVDADRIALLRALGFNRLSLGVQDFDPAVQQAVNRIQSNSVTRAAVDAARNNDFRSVSIDLIYGLPQQTVRSFNQTLNHVIALNPDRIAIYNYAHLPHLFKTQRRIDAAALPTPATKLDILAQCIERLVAAGYVYIGMDHFAKPHDDLAIAQRQGRLHRNFQGYSTHADCDLIGLGVSAIGAIGPSYSQNEKNLDAYYAHLAAGQLPIQRGIALTMDDLLRRTVIHSLMCQAELSMSAVEQAYPITFAEYFATEMQALEALEREDLITLEPDWINVTLKGRLLIRNIAMVFDRHLQQPTSLRYSKTI